MSGPVGILIVLAFALVAGCIKAPAGEVGSHTDSVGEEQIAALHAASAYDVVLRTQPEYLYGRGRESLDPRIPPIPADVYVDDTYYGDVKTLRVIPASELSEVRFFQSYDAQLRFGSGHMGGVIQLITKH